jgi:dTDP-L-rhamnose 4-epimerase
VEDVANAFVAAVTSERTPDCEINVGSGIATSVAEIARQLGAAFHASPQLVVTGQYRSGDVRHIVADPARAADVLGFRAAVDPRDGLREFAFAPLRA